MIKDNTTTNAYDSFWQVLNKGDLVICSIPRYTYGADTFILCKGIITGWTAKRIDVEIKEVQTNTDIRYIENWAGDVLGQTRRLKPDKIYKIK